MRTKTTYEELKPLITEEIVAQGVCTKTTYEELKLT